MERHKILGDKVALYRRTPTGPWHCYTFLKGQEWRQSTKELKRFFAQVAV